MTHIEQSSDTLSIMRSRAMMPNSCMGGNNYYHLTVIEHKAGKCPKIATSTKDAQIVESRGPLYRGKTKKSEYYRQLNDLKATYF